MLLPRLATRSRWNRSALPFRTASSSSNTITDTSSATEIVDYLLARTEQLMQLRNAAATTMHHTVAFSGGVDSSLVAYLVHTVASSHTTTTAASAMLGVSPAVSSEQVEAAHRIAHHVGIPLQVITTNEGDDPLYIANDGQACFACKNHLYTTMAAIQRHTSTSPSLQLYNGTNQDDLADPTRSGLRAATAHNVVSPLATVTKAHVRQAAAHVQLPNAYTAAAPCLRSRLQWGVPATRDHLHAVERMERFVRTQLGELEFLTSALNLRVRLLAGQRICVQVDADQLARVEALYAEQRAEWDNLFLTQEGFRSIELRSFASGSVASFGERKEVKLQRHVVRRAVVGKDDGDESQDA